MLPRFYIDLFLIKKVKCGELKPKGSAGNDLLPQLIDHNAPLMEKGAPEKKRHSRMYYIWCDESDSEGAFYSNFYGGILIRSMDLHYVLNRLRARIQELGIDREEIKWQKVNRMMFAPYKSLVDTVFDLLEEDKMKIRIFFRHNQYVPKYLDRRQMNEEYSLLYYQFLKHAFGFIYSNPTDRIIDLNFALDEMPIDELEKKKFKGYLVHLSEDKNYKLAKIRVKDENVYEVDSKRFLPLQVVDLILGAICFRLNDKHRQKLPDMRKRGVRTIMKEKLYKHINFRIRQLRRGFNIGVSTGFSEPFEIWDHAYRHWSFIPKEHYVDETRTKHFWKIT